jgi:hypothetical protein
MWQRAKCLGNSILYEEIDVKSVGGLLYSKR